MINKIDNKMLNKKNPIQSFIESNKFLGSKEYIGLSTEIEWFLTKKAVEYLIEQIKNNKINIQ